MLLVCVCGDLKHSFKKLLSDRAVRRARVEEIIETKKFSGVQPQRDRFDSDRKRGASPNPLAR